MKTLLCYGDSNTWGYIPQEAGKYDKPKTKRYTWPKRWTGVLQASLGEDWRVIENGLNSRNVIFSDPFNFGRNGLERLQESLEIALPIEAFLLMLGTNDLKTVYGVRPWDIGFGVECIIDNIERTAFILGYEEPKVLLISPILLGNMVYGEGMGLLFDEQSYEKSLQLAEVYKTVAARNSCEFLNAADFAEPGIDGLHLDELGHKSLGEAIAKKVKTMF